MTLARVLRAIAFVLTLVLGLVVARTASAHKPSDSYLTVAANDAQLDVRWDIALRDLQNVMALDQDANGVITWGELRAHRDEVFALAARSLRLAADGAPCPAEAKELEVAGHSDGAYAVLHLAATCPRARRSLEIGYALFFEVDPQHRGIARLDEGGETRTAIFSSTHREEAFPRAEHARAHQLAAAIVLGVEHIFSGIDHLLFLIALLIPAVLVRGEGRRAWQPVPRFGAALSDVLKIVTAFTVAHSLTLSLSALGVLRLPSRLVESGIAASVIVAAVNNVVPLLDEERWAAAFALGLLHGFGFSATLMDLGLPRQNLVLTLFGFNVGVELGQLCVVATFLPLAYLARNTVAYRRWMVIGGSLAIALVATAWLVERAFAVKIF